MKILLFAYLVFEQLNNIEWYRNEIKRELTHTHTQICIMIITIPVMSITHNFASIYQLPYYCSTHTHMIDMIYKQDIYQTTALIEQIPIHVVIIIDGL